MTVGQCEIPIFNLCIPLGGPTTVVIGIERFNWRALEISSAAVWSFPWEKGQE